MSGPPVHPMSPGDPYVDLATSLAGKSVQPRFLVDWEQGPTGVDDRRDYPDPAFNPQEITPVGGDHEEYPANPVIFWDQRTIRDPSQSIKVQNGGQTHIALRASLDQQRGRQQPPQLYPNMVVQSPPDWDDGVNIVPPAIGTGEAARIAIARQVAGYSPQTVL